MQMPVYSRLQERSIILSSSLTQAFTTILNSFNISEVFSSVQNFLSSGYIFVIFVALMLFGALNKLIKLVIAGAAIGLVWLLVTTGIQAGWFGSLPPILG